MGDAFHRNRRRTSAFAAGLFFLLALPAPVLAQPVQAAQDCDKGQWSLDRDRVALGEPRKPDLGNGAKLALPTDAAITVLMSPMSAAILPHPPTKPQDRGYGGILRLSVPEPPGVWQITVPAYAWIDVFVGGKTLSPLAFTGPSNCPGVRKSLRYRLPPGEVVLQLAGAEEQRMAIFIDRVENKPARPR